MSLSGHMRSIMKRERRVTLMILAMLVAYLGTWTPYAVICILRMCGFHLSPLMDGYALLTAKTSGAINPFIFIFMNKSVSIVHIGLEKKIHNCIHSTYLHTYLLLNYL